MAVDVCTRIWFRVNCAISWAISASLMDDSAACKFSAEILRALTERCSRFCTAPTLPRAAVTDAIAVSMVVSAVKASAEAVTESEAIPKVDDVTASRERESFKSILLFAELSIPI